MNFLHLYAKLPLKYFYFALTFYVKHSSLAFDPVCLMKVSQSLVVSNTDPLSRLLCYEGKFAIPYCCVDSQVCSSASIQIFSHSICFHKVFVSFGCFAVEKSLMIYHCDIFHELMKQVCKFVTGFVASYST